MANVIITIGRQYGSSGRYIGELAAKELGIPFYDSEILTLAAAKGELSHEAAAEADERNANSLLYTLAMGSSAMLHSSHYNMPINDKLFLAQTEVIKEIAQKESAVIVGRCADYILREHPYTFNVFVYADMDARVEKISKRMNIGATEARNLINKTDRRRANYYNFYTGNKWGDVENYDISINSSKIGSENAAKLIASLVKIYQK